MAVAANYANQASRLPKRRSPWAGQRELPKLPHPSQTPPDRAGPRIAATRTARLARPERQAE